VENTRLGPYWATYISMCKLDIPDLVSLYDTAQLALQSWLVSPAYLFSLQNGGTANLGDRPILQVRLFMRNRLNRSVETISRYNSLILADRRLEMRFS